MRRFKSPSAGRAILGAAAAAAGVALLAAGVPSARANVTITGVLYPAEAAASSGDAAPAGNSTTYAPGYASSCWETNGQKLELYLSPSSGQMFNETVGLGASAVNLSSVSYWTDKLNAVQGDWYVNIYTNTTGSGDAASWYHDRLAFTPETSNGSYSSTAALNTWRQASTDSNSGNQLVLTAVNDTFLGTPDSLTTVESDSAYNTQTIKYLVLTVSSSASTLNSLVDGLQFSASDGSNATFNLETPEPATLSLLALGGLGLLARRRRRKVAVT